MGLREKLLRQKKIIAHKINIFSEIAEDEESAGLRGKMMLIRRISAIQKNIEDENIL